MPTSILYRIPEEILSMILCFAMERNSPFLIDNLQQTPLKAVDVVDSQLIYETSKIDGRHTHVSDWIAVNSTSRLIRRVGREAFFKTKLFAMNSQLASDLLRPEIPKFGFARVLLNPSPENNLARMRHLYLTDADVRTSAWIKTLPDILALHFPHLKRCVLVFGYGTRTFWCRLDEDLALKIPCSIIRPVGDKLKKLLVGIGMRKKLVLQKTRGLEASEEQDSGFEEHRDSLIEWWLG